MENDYNESESSNRMLSTRFFGLGKRKLVFFYCLNLIAN